METYLFDVKAGSLDQMNAQGEKMTSAQRLRGRLRFILGSEAHGPVDRSEFIASRSELDAQLDAVDVQLVDEPDKASSTIWLPPAIGRRLDIPANVPITADAVELLCAEDRKTRHVLADGIDHAKRGLRDQALEEAWWFRFEDKKAYRYNPFRQEPTEQYVLDNGGTPFNVYNFAQPVTRSQLMQIAETVDLMSQLTNGISAKIVPNMVIHEAFQPIRFARSGYLQQPGGQAWLGDAFIELHASALGNDWFSTHGSAGQTWLQQVMVHEITHQIDEAADQGRSIFRDYFQYIDHDGDARIDAIHPKHGLASAARGRRGRSAHDLAMIYGAAAVSKSAPHRDYGYTSPAEDLPVTAEEAAFGGHVDSLRRDAFIHVLQRLVKSMDPADRPIAMPATGPSDMAIERRIGKQIWLPAIDSLRSPLKVMVAVRPSIGKRVFDLLTD